MSNHTTYETFIHDNENRRIFEQESLAAEATELISQLMNREEISKSELATRIGKSKAFVTQLLGGSRNMTLHTLADLAFATGYRVDFKVAPLKDGTGTSCEFPMKRIVNFPKREAALAASCDAGLDHSCIPYAYAG